MKNFLLSFFLIIVFVNLSFSQIKSAYSRGFEVGFKEGYCYNNKTVDCFTPLTPLAPMPRLNESKESYTDGYNRGFQFGLDLKRSKEAMNASDNNLSQIPTFNKYVSQNPIDEMKMVGMYKQQKYDVRTKWLQERIYQLTDLIGNLFNNKNLPSIAIEPTRNIYIVKLNNYVNSILGVDFADDNQFSNVVNGFNSIESYFYKSYNSCIDNENKISTNKEFGNKELEASSNNLSPDFVNFLNKNEGNYDCALNYYKLTGDVYEYIKTSHGKLKISGLRIDYKEKGGDWEFRDIISSSIDEKNNDYICKTRNGDIRINRNWDQIIFYNNDDTCNSYIPYWKTRNPEEENKKK